MEIMGYEPEQMLTAKYMIKTAKETMAEENNDINLKKSVIVKESSLEGLPEDQKGNIDRDTRYTK